MATCEKEIHEPNSYFESFAGIAADLDALAKAVTPDAGDDLEPAPGAARPCCNSYFESFKAIRDALSRLRDATGERLASPVRSEQLPPDVAAAVAEMAAIPSAYGFCRQEMSEFERIELRNRAVNRVALDAHSPYIVLPPAIDGKARDFILRVEGGGGARLIMPRNVEYESDCDGVFDAIPSDATAVFFFLETKPGVFLVSRKDVATVSQ